MGEDVENDFDPRPAGHYDWIPDGDIKARTLEDAPSGDERIRQSQSGGENERDGIDTTTGGERCAASERTPREREAQ